MAIRLHECRKCQKSYTYKKNLQRHLKFECGVVPRCKCPYCEYCTRYNHSLKTHMQSQHNHMIQLYKSDNSQNLINNLSENYKTNKF